VILWYLLSKGESYGCARSSLHPKKLREAEHGEKGVANAHIIKSHRDQERRWVEQAETAYARFVAGRNPRGRKRMRTGAATEVRR